MAAPLVQDDADLAPADLVPAGTQHEQEVAELSSCSGYAPLLTQCENEHVIHDDYVHTCLGGPGYTGTIVSHAFFTHDVESIVTCHYEDGELVDQTVESPGYYFSGSRMTHTCTSYEYRTTSTEGGTGAWTCLFSHN